ncbi:SRSF protein kinase 3 isoform X3 [Prionailurus viverrinus]|uniref:SRSF protein kinase 3 isoform X3 n=1 Tax=Prionailurus viverrinus TaxID=61388 RepID=UPI001FF3E470|nr:SRSF protein kinase 3 isoform X3 [Prionailurus viverrinus]
MRGPPPGPTGAAARGAGAAGRAAGMSASAGGGGGDSGGGSSSSSQASCGPESSGSELAPATPAPRMLQGLLGSDDEEQEDPKDYCKGGYYPVKIGDLFNGRYHVVRKLGWGHFSTVWLCWDIQRKRFVALKVVKSAGHYTETAVDEIKLLKCVRDSDPSDPKRETIVQLIDDFRISGVNGVHVCMVLEVLGHQLLKWIIKSNYQGLPVPCVKSIVRQTSSPRTSCCVWATPTSGAWPRRPQSGSSRGPRPHPVPQSALPPRRSCPGSCRRTRGRRCGASGNCRSGCWRSACGTCRGWKPWRRRPRPRVRGRGARPASAGHRGAGSHPASAPLPRRWLEARGGQRLHLLFRLPPRGRGRGRPLPRLLLPRHRGRAQPQPGLPDVRLLGLPFLSRLVLHPLRLLQPAGDRGPPVAQHTVWCLEPPGEPPRAPKRRQDQDQDRRPGQRLLGAQALHRGHPDTPVPGRGSADRSRVRPPRRHLEHGLHGTPQLPWPRAGPPPHPAPAGSLTFSPFQAFELATGDYLFEPHSGEDYSRDEDHIAHIVELLGDIPPAFALSGRYSREFFNRRGELRHIHNLKHWGLYEVLMEKYEWPLEQATQFSAFLLPMMEYIPEKRASAADCLRHPWLNP